MIKSVCEYFNHLAKEKLHSFVPRCQDRFLNSTIFSFFLLFVFSSVLVKSPTYNFSFIFAYYFNESLHPFPNEGWLKTFGQHCIQKGNNTNSSIPHPAALTHTLSLATAEADCLRPHHRQRSGQQNSWEEADRPTGGNHLQLLPGTTNRWGSPATDHQGIPSASPHIWQPSDHPAVVVVVY